MSKKPVIPANAGTQSVSIAVDDAKTTGSPVKLGMTQNAWQQFGKYMAGGSLYFWVGYAIFAICYSGLHWYWLWAKILADAIGWSSNYVVQRYWAFAEQHHLSEMQHVGRYLFIESVGFVLDYLIIAGLRLIGITPYIGFFLAAGFFTIWSWYWYKYWVFPKKEND